MVGIILDGAVHQELIKGQTGDVDSHQCQYGLMTHIYRHGGQTGPAKKPIVLTSNRWCFLEELGRKCNGEHRHIALIAGRAKHTAEYPVRLCEAICRDVLLVLCG